MSYSEISAAQLVDIAKGNKDYIILDCRSFLVYNKGHITKAVNVRYNSIMKRRTKGVFSLENAITNTDIRKKFLSGSYSTVVVYGDQCGNTPNEESQTPKTKRTTSLVLDTVQKHAPNETTITYLSCGFKEFLRLYPEQCSGISSETSLALPEAENKELQTCRITPVYDQGMPVQILPHLYLGSAYQASQKNNLESLGITSVINASSTCPNYFENELKYKRIPVEDNNQADISSWFNEAINFINDAKSSNEKVLVHCHAGISRSATLCLAYLITCHRLSLSEAFDYVKCRRSVISPNLNFMGQLLKLESDIASEDQTNKSFDLWNRRESNDIQANRRPRSQNLHLPLGQHNEKTEPNHLCLTAPAGITEFNFFPDPQLSCSRESAEMNSHSITTPTFALST